MKPLTALEVPNPFLLWTLYWVTGKLTYLKQTKKILQLSHHWVFINQHACFKGCAMPQLHSKEQWTIFSDLKLLCVLVYLDNINVFSCTFQEHMDHLQEAFERLIRNNLKLKPSKCHFFKSQIEYLGFTIDANGLQPRNQKLKLSTECLHLLIAVMFKYS